MKFQFEKDCPRIVLSDEELKIAEHWIRETSKRSVEIRLKRGEQPSAAVIASDLSNHDMSVKGEFAVDYFFNGTASNAVENSQKFCRGSSLTKLIPDIIIGAIIDAEACYIVRNEICVEVKSTRRKDYPEALKLPIKEEQFRDYQRARDNGEFDKFAYILTVTVRGHPNAVDLVGFAREDDIIKSISLNNRDSHGNYVINHLNLHLLDCLTAYDYETSETVGDRMKKAAAKDNKHNDNNNAKLKVSKTLNH
jgi:hypothetical protein